MVFNLVSRLNPKGSEWGTMLKKLREQALSNTEKFGPQHIAAVHNLVSKLDNPAEWQPLLQKLQTQTYGTWTKFKAKIKEIRNGSSISRGRSQFNNNYAQFLISITDEKNSINLDDIERLGAVEKFNDAFYFKQSPECVQYATEVLEAFWSSDERIKSTRLYHQEKCEKIFINQEAEALDSSCISFVAANINAQKWCFICPSSYEDAPIINELKTFIKDYNSDVKTTKFAVMAQGDLRNLNALIKLLIPDSDENNTCAEKAYTKGLIKLWLEGLEMQITGVANCPFYPHEKNQKTDRLVKPLTLDSNILNIRKKSIY